MHTILQEHRYRISTRYLDTVVGSQGEKMSDPNEYLREYLEYLEESIDNTRDYYSIPLEI